MTKWMTGCGRTSQPNVFAKPAPNPEILVYFKRAPGAPGTGGIEGLQYRVSIDHTEVSKGTTASDGKATVQVKEGAASLLEILVDGKPVATYSIRKRDDAWEAPTAITGVQRRLRALGYHLGHGGTGKDGIDGGIGKQTDKAIHDFQIDQGLECDGLVGGNTRAALKREVGGTA